MYGATDPVTCVTNGNFFKKSAEECVRAMESAGRAVALLLSALLSEQVHLSLMVKYF